MADRIVTRDPNLTPEKIAHRRQRMSDAAARMRRHNLALDIALAVASPGPAMSVAEFAAALDDPEQIPE